MKKFFTNIFNIAAIAGFVLTIAMIIGIFGSSYHLVNKMAEQGKSELPKTPSKKSQTKAPEDKTDKPGGDIKVTEASKTLQALSQKLASFNDVDVIEQEMTKTAIPPICNIICDQSAFDFRAAEGAARENPVLYLSDFYKQEGRRAFADPKFRLALETTRVYSDFFSPSTRQTIFELGQDMGHIGQMSETEKIALSAKLPFMVLKVGTQFASRITDLQERANRASEMNQLRKSCDGGKVKDVVRECESL
ncbi:MAG: hypothetical protein JSU04_07305 [Bdellovibrionales bacterium]|nr:hypothetical protein [Bdellovibrionales bacterium]